MSFANPWALIGLIAIIPLVLMYLFKEHVRTLNVSSLLFWEQLEAHTQPTKTVRMRRFLSSPAFWIQLILLILLIGVLAEPVIERRARKMVLLMDISASMQTREANGSRLDLAKQKASDLIDGLENADRMAIVTMGSAPRIAMNFTDNKEALRETIDDLQALDTSTGLQASISLVSSMQDSLNSLDVVVISDQYVERLSTGLDSTRIQFSFRVVGETGENVGFIALNQQAGLLGIQNVSGDLLLRNFVAEPKQGTLQFIQDGVTLLDTPIEIPPSGSVPVIIPELESSAPVTAILNVADSLEIDNQVVFLPAAQKKPTMLVITNDNRFAALCRQVDAFQVTIQSGQNVPPPQPFDVYVYDRVQPTDYPSGGTVIISPPGTGQTIREREIYDWDNKHPLLRDIVMERLSLAGARILNTLPTWGTVLAQTRSHPVVVAGTYEAYNRVIITADIARQQESPSALLLLLKSLEWVSPGASQDLVHIGTGETYIKQVPATSELMTIRSPDGERLSVQPQEGVVSFAQTTRSGVYEMEIGEDTHFFAANLLDALESDILPVSAGMIDNQPLEFQSQAMVEAVYWRWVLWGCLVLLMLEWGYHFLRRRNTVEL